MAAPMKADMGGNSWKWIATGGAVAVALAIGGYLLLGQDDQPPKATVPPPVINASDEILPTPGKQDSPRPPGDGSIDEGVRRPPRDVPADLGQPAKDDPPVKQRPRHGDKPEPSAPPTPPAVFREPGIG